MKDSILSPQKITLIFQYLRYWKLICVFGFGFAILGFIVAWVNKPKYVSTLSFVVDAENMSSLGGLSGLAGSMGLGSLSQSESVFEGDNLIELLTTKNILESALLKKIPHTKKTFAQDFLEFSELLEKYENDDELKKEDYTFKYGEPRNKFSYQKDSILKDVFFRLKTTGISAKIKNNKVNIITVTVTTKGSTFSRYFSEALMSETTKFYIKTTTKKARTSYEILKNQVDSVRNELYTAMVSLASSNDNIFGLNPTQNIMRIPSTKRQMDVQINSAILTELVKNMEISRVNLLNKTPIFQIIENPRFPLDEKKFRKVYGVILGGLLGGIIGLGLVFLKLKYLQAFNWKNVLAQINEQKNKNLQ